MEKSRVFSRSATSPNRFFSHSITITSESGVGSSTALKCLQGRLGLLWRFVSGGSIMRAFAAQLGVSIEKLAELNLERPEMGYDRNCDRMIADFGMQNYVVIEGRLPHVFVPHAFHVRLVCPYEVRTERRHRDQPGTSLREIAHLIAERDRCDNERYERMYPECLWPDKDFDLVIDTSQVNPEQATNAIVSTHRKWAEDKAEFLIRQVCMVPLRS